MFDGRISWPTLRSALIVPAIVAWSLSMQSMGGLFVFVGLFVVIYLPFGAYGYFRHPLRRRQLLAKWLAWVLAISVGGAVQWWRHDQARHRADRVVLAIEDFHQANGHYPASLMAIGIDDVSRRQELPVPSYYHLGDDGVPSLFYRSTFNGFDTFSYDFSQRQWIFYPD
jgi:hypothetical protein